MAKMRFGFLLFMSMFFLISSLSSGYKFNVGGKGGWAVKPSAGYAQWAHTLRFQINDTLYFKYDKASDSVLVVNKQDYDSCNTRKPIQKLEGGESIFNLDRSGSFYFISGNVENCQKGEKLTVSVLSPRHGHKDHGPSTSPWVAPVHSPAPSWTAPAPRWIAPAPERKAPAPGWTAPVPAWNAPSPSWTAPAPHWKSPSPGIPGWTSPAPHWKAPSPDWTAPAPKSKAPSPGWTAPAPGWKAPAPSAPPSDWKSPSPSRTAPTPSPSVWTAPTPSAPEGYAPEPSKWDAPAPSPKSSGSMKLCVSHGVMVAVALVLASFVF